MANLPIYKSSETLNERFAPSFNAAAEALERAFGFAVEVRSPLGGARTKEQCNSLGTPWWISNHYEGSQYAAVDIWNHDRFRSIDEDLFYRILAQYGWLNVQVNGRPFPSEPWHVANHSKTPLIPAVANFVTLDPDLEYIMSVPFDLIADNAGPESKGYVLVSSTFEHVGSAEWEALNNVKADLIYNAENGFPPDHPDAKKPSPGFLADASNALRRAHFTVATLTADEIVPRH